MIQNLINIFKTYPEILIFLTLALGYLIGKTKIFGITLGTTTGILLISLIFGQIDLEISPLLKNVGFALFIFFIGYQSGPKIFKALKKEGIKYILLSIIIAITGLITVLTLGKLFNFDIGETAGLLSGALTQSSIIGTATDSIRQLPIAASQKLILENNIASAYILTYIIGLLGLIILVKIIAKLMNINSNIESKIPEKTSTNLDKTEITDLFIIGIGCTIGALIGLITIKINEIPISLGTGSGILISGLFFGWLNSVNPKLRQIPKTSQWLLNNLGLNLFIACIGLSTGKEAIKILELQGLSIIFAGMFAILIPVFVGLIFGKFILKLNPVLLLGAITGALTCTPALNALEEDLNSHKPTIGYTIPYALNNIILTIFGNIIVIIMYII